MSKSKKSEGSKKSAKARGKKTPAETPIVTTAEAGTPLPVSKKTRMRDDGTMSLLDAAAKVLGDAKEPLNCKTIVDRALEVGYWKTGGKTPASTLNAAINVEIKKKGDSARFVKEDRGQYALKT